MSLVRLKPGLEVEYPESDGRPMGETEIHRDWMIYVYEILKQRYRTDRVYIGSDLLMYYVEDEPSHYVVPDVFLVFDCDPSPRRTYKLWEERRVPNVVFEVTSKSTRQRDTVAKLQTYAEIGVAEYFLYDPTNEYLSPALQGYRLIEGSYLQIEPNSTGALESHELGVSMRLDDGELLFEDVSSSELLLTREEAATQRAEIASRRVEVEQQRAEIEKQRAELETQRAEREARRAAAAEAKAQRLEEELRQLKERLEGDASTELERP